MRAVTFFVTVLGILTSVIESKIQGGGKHVFDDMILNEYQYKEAFGSNQNGQSNNIEPNQRNSGIDGDKYRWKNGELPYKFDKSVPKVMINAVNEAVKHFNEKLDGCIKIRPADKSDQDFVLVVSHHRGCSSEVGRQGQEQRLNLHISDCFSREKILHEFIHALGFYHEHNRPDRDDHVEVLWFRIKNEAMKKNFQKQRTSRTFDVEYDPRSIMHYKMDDHGDGQNTLLSLMKNVKSSELGSSKDLTEKDVEKLKRMYKCGRYIESYKGCPSYGCPVDQLVYYKMIGKLPLTCHPRCNFVTIGDYRMIKKGSGFQCFDTAHDIPQWTFCCRTRNIKGGIPKCPNGY